VLVGVFLAVTALSIRFMRSILPTADASPSPLEIRQAP
jgi:hypothetical protein